MKWNEVIELKENEEKLLKFIRKEGKKVYLRAVEKTIEDILENLNGLYRENLCNRYVFWHGSNFEDTIRECLPHLVCYLSQEECDQLQEKGDGQYEEYLNAIKAENFIDDCIVSYYDDGGKGVFDFFDNFEIPILRERGESVDGQFDIAHTEGSSLMLFRVCEWCLEEYKLVLHKALNHIDEFFKEKRWNDEVQERSECTT